ncbi:response regulator receiver protein [Moorena producens PAL-8-15-08-1]|uniref:Response regulator receiver protein n=1 Tax=Moorena producens PAL-8-15-08-1 TaxID=1458985 RepID=A0A1D8U1S0_9CYAN|nr:DUF3685 domain-containing protein [Moorena producens]AOX03795.1 response regulator receiver protein [Moorena producens PAL-8-15-08-1]
MSDRITHILLIDDDPVFRLGLRTALQAFQDLLVVAEADTGTEARSRLAALEGTNSVDVAILELALAEPNSNQEVTLSGLPLCQGLRREYPNLPILLLTRESKPTVLAVAQALGVNGYCPKGVAIATIVEAIGQIIEGQSYWQTLSSLPTVSYKAAGFAPWYQQWRNSGFQQFEAALGQVNSQLQNPRLSNWDWLFWTGRRRELLVARWLADQLLPASIILVEPSRDNALVPMPKPETSLTVAPRAQSQLSPNGALVERRVERTMVKLQSGLSNLSGVPLELDILQVEKRAELLGLVFQTFETLIEDLRLSEVKLEQLPQKQQLILKDLWEASVTDFFGKYYTLYTDNTQLEVVTILLGNYPIVKKEILDKIPLVIDLLAHRLFDSSLIIDNVSYPAHTPEAIQRSEFILDNLIIQIGNGVIQPLLNQLADVESIKGNFYHKNLMSSREIARFRNNLSWRYRQDKLFGEPQAIFESRYDLFILTDTGIKQTSIYAPRRRELERLRGFQLAVTLAYELRDALSPRMQAAVTWIGNGVVYVLTQVFGRSIGLVVRGVIQGIGNSVQEARFGKNPGRGK